MTPERYRLVTRVFLEACGVATDARADFLNSQCGEDQELRQCVEKMLAQDDRESAASLPIPPAQRLAPPTPSVAEGDLPNTIGDYRILKKLGEGGMGVVYLAEQKRPRRTVALKVIRAQALSSKILRRFENESQILGRLQHPGIAQIFEAGTAATDRGQQPFFAMEYIEGRPLTEYATAKKLKVRPRLALMVAVCDAVQHAHQKGVIHRDLKPANILVDVSGQPRILDFGVARVTDSDVQVTTIQTDIGQLLGTIPYMSPEQVGGNVDELDTRSDVYALGVICYQLLTGRLPHDLRRKQISEAARIIQEEEPPSLASINRSYRGDIETIVSKALEKDRRRRYQSASELGADIRRYLNDEPIIARPTSSFTHFRKFARRNKALVTGVAVAFVLLTWGLIHVTIERNRAVRAEKRAIVAEQEAMVEAGKARTEAQKAERVIDFLKLVMVSGDPEVSSQRGEITVVEAIDWAVGRIDSLLGEEPEVEADVRNTIGTILSDLGRYPEAEKQLTQALDLRRRLLGERHEDVAETMTGLGILRSRMGQYEQAAELHRQAISIQRKTLGPDHQSLIQSLNSLGSASRRLGRREEAERLYREALEISRRSLDEKDQLVARCLNNLASVLVYAGEIDEAEALFQEALRIFRHVYGERNVQSFKVLNNLGYIRKRRGDIEGTIRLNRQALVICREFYGELHPLTATMMNNLAVTLRQQGDLAESEKMYRQVIDLRRTALGEKHPKVSLAMNNLAYLMYVSDRYEEAEAIFRKSLAIQRESLPAEHLELLNTLGKLSNVIMARGQFDVAEPLLREGLRIAKKHLNEGDRGMGLTKSKLGRCLLALQKAEEAEPLLVQAFDVFREEGRLSRGEGAACLGALIQLYETTDRPDQAARYQALAPKPTSAAAVAPKGTKPH